MQWLAVAIGAGFGACFRAWLGRFNTHLNDSVLFHWLPLGTLIANVLGGLLVGIAIVLFEYFSDSVHPYLKMMIVTGFLGGLTTFSTFSSEVFHLMNDGRMLLGLSLAGIHLFFTLCATAVGFYFVKMIVQ